LKQEREKQSDDVERMLRKGSQAEADSRNCEEAARRYFGRPASPSEGMNKLCPIVTDAKGHTLK